MVLKFIRRRRHRGGQFIAFDKCEGTAATKSKPIWTKANPEDVVQQMMAKESDNTDATAQMSSIFLLQEQDHGDSGDWESYCNDIDDDDDDDEEAGAFAGEADREGPNTTSTDRALAPIPERKSTPSWFKRPMFSNICSNHALVNAERQWVRTGLHPLKRCRELDEIARWHAEAMAADACAYHADAAVLCSKLTIQPTVRLGENVAKGKSVRILHSIMKEHAANYANMMDVRYTHMGMATARSSNGDWYLCQLFRG